MPGPVPKTAAVRQRRNKSASRTDLPAVPPPNRPRLPGHPHGHGWHQMATRWWKDVWDSPMSAEFLDGDFGALFRLAFLVDQYWRNGELEVAREIRLMEREFGLTPLARRRLEWQVAQTEDAKDKHNLRRAKRAAVIEGNDPRQVLD